MEKIIIGGFVGVLLTASTAFAADMPVRGRRAVPPPAPPPLETSWSGWYIGFNAGAAFGGHDPVRVEETRNGSLYLSGTWPGHGDFGKLDLGGGFGGGQLGYNWQSGNWVYGIETDIQGSGISDRRDVQLPYISAGNTIRVDTRSSVDWFGTLRGRLGMVWNNTLIYATGGLAYGGVNYRVHMDDTFNYVTDHDWNPTRVGYAVGAGWEFHLAPGWTGKFEYQYVDLGTFGISAPELLFGAPSAFAIHTEAWPNFHTFRFGLNYHYGAMPL